MSLNPNHGRTASAPVRVLPELVFDLSDGGPAPAALGKTDTPVHVLSDQPFDLGAPQPSPALQLTLRVRAGAAPGEVALDLFRLYAALNELERSYHGAGLTPGASHCDATPTNGILHVIFKPADPDGAEERLTRLAETIQSAIGHYPCIERWEAKVVRAVA